MPYLKKLNCQFSVQNLWDELLEQLKAAIETLQYPFLDLNHLYMPEHQKAKKSRDFEI